MVDGHQLADGFQLHDYGLVHQQIDSVPHVDLGAVIHYRQWQFCFYLPAALNKVVAKARPIGTLE